MDVSLESLCNKSGRYRRTEVATEYQALDLAHLENLERLAKVVKVIVYI
jgi:hypothetical protein